MNNQYRGGGLPKKGGFRQFADLRRAWQERGGYFWGGGVDTTMHTMLIKE